MGSDPIKKICYKIAIIFRRYEPLTGFLTAGIIRTALEVGLVYSLVALSLFIS